MSKLRRLPASLPMRYAPDLFDDDEDVAYDDGRVFFHGSVYGQHLEIHDLIATDKALRGGRSGIGRLAMKAVRPHFDRITACQVGDDTAPIIDQAAFLFWRRMLVDGLVDGISIGYGGSVITRDNMHEEIATCYGTFVPTDGMVELAIPRM